MINNNGGCNERQGCGVTIWFADKLRNSVAPKSNQTDMKEEL